MAESNGSLLRTIIPMKPLAEAKTRLVGSELTQLQIQGFVLMMLDNVVRAVTGATGPGSCLVVGGDAFVRKVAESGGAALVEDPGGGLNASIWSTMLTAYRAGARACLFLPGDLPFASVDDVVALSLASDDYSRPVAVQASSDGGTNALLQPAAVAFKPLLGKDSFARHKAEAQRRGTPLQILDRPGVAFDVDTRVDYQCAKENIKRFAAQAQEWQAWLYQERGGAP